MFPIDLKFNLEAGQIKWPFEKNTGKERHKIKGKKRFLLNELNSEFWPVFINNCDIVHLNK